MCYIPPAVTLKTLYIFHIFSIYLFNISIKIETNYSCVQLVEALR